MRTGKEQYFHATKFWGKLFLINIAMGVVTGIVQEFQFGMNWSDYSRFVGDVFGAPLAFEALIAFFFESTFIGLWIFGWDKLPKKIHCACMWMVRSAPSCRPTSSSPPTPGCSTPAATRSTPSPTRPELTDIGAVLTQNTTLVQVLHTLAASFLTGARLHGRHRRLPPVAGRARARAGRAATAADTRRIGVMRASLRTRPGARGRRGARSPRSAATRWAR